MNRIPVLFLSILVYITCVMAVIQISTSIPVGDTHTTLSVSKRGDKALFRLYKLHFNTTRLISDWSSLTQKISLLVVSEPIIRTPTKQEKSDLQKWVSNGGTLLYLLSPSDSSNSNSLKPLLLKDTSSNYNTLSTNVEKNNTPLLSGVKSLSIDATFSELPAAYHPVVNGQIAERHYGKGIIILVSSAHFITNDELELADNAMFAYNVATFAENRRHGIVMFDEYHQGLGLTVEAQQSLQSDFKTYWLLSPSWIRYSLLAIIAICFMSIYNGNKIFGDFANPPKQNSKKLNTVDALAGLYLKVNANDYALNILEDDFRRTLLRNMDMPEFTSHAEFLQMCKSLPITSEEIDLLFGYMQREQAHKKISKSELQMVALKIDEIKRRLELVGK